VVNCLMKQLNQIINEILQWKTQVISAIHVGILHHLIANLKYITTLSYIL